MKPNRLQAKRILPREPGDNPPHLLAWGALIRRTVTWMKDSLCESRQTPIADNANAPGEIQQRGLGNNLNPPLLGGTYMDNRYVAGR